MINNIGIISLGSIGSRHLRIARNLRPQLNIIAIRSSKESQVKQEKLVDSTVYSIDRAIDAGIEAAIISSPAVFHIQQAINLMENGIHVLIEKPLSHSSINVDKLLKIAKKRNLVGLVGYCFRYDPCALKFKEILDKKNIGKILNVQVECSSYLPDWRQGVDYRQSVSGKAELGGGVLLELSHEFHYVRWFFGNMKSITSSKIQNSGLLDINVEDTADIVFRSKQNFLVSIHLDFNSKKISRKCIAECANGNIIWDAIENKITWQLNNEFKEFKSSENDRDYIYIQQLKHFFDCIENKQRPLVSIDDGAAILNMIESAKKSDKISKKVILA